MWGGSSATDVIPDSFIRSFASCNTDARMEDSDEEDEAISAAAALAEASV
jgi:hypothetical protein